MKLIKFHLQHQQDKIFRTVRFPFFMFNCQELSGFKTHAPLILPAPLRPTSRKADRKAQGCPLRPKSETTQAPVHFQGLFPPAPTPDNTIGWARILPSLIQVISHLWKRPALLSPDTSTSKKLPRKLLSIWHRQSWHLNQIWGGVHPVSSGWPQQQVAWPGYGDGDHHHGGPFFVVCLQAGSAA